MDKKVKIRKFNESDIEYKINWINDSNINKYLHYDIPITKDKTLDWYKKNIDNTKRLDYTIIYSENDMEIPVGLIGILNKDFINKKAEFYIALGDKNYFRKGISKEATLRLLNICFEDDDLNKIYLYTEVENEAAIALFESIGFRKEGRLNQDLIYRGRIIDRYIYAITRKDFNNEYRYNTYRQIET